MRPGTALRVDLSGMVQGIGVRPAVARLAVRLALTGYVGNTRNGVEIHVEGDATDRFVAELTSNLPVEARITAWTSQAVVPMGYSEFRVGYLPPERANGAVDGRAAPLSTRVPADLRACDECLGETRDGPGRRKGYAFTSCTACGPRYTILDAMPYERARTSMAPFTLCADCRREYDSPDDRRFHAQTNACPRCGPRIWLHEGDCRIVAWARDAIAAAACILRQGRIVALRGLGGYQLLVDAESEEAVVRLRERKRRRAKPLAVMVRSLSHARELAVLDDVESTCLAAPSGPIVVVRRRPESPVAPSVSGELATVGLMLPTTPLHALLCDAARTPLVCTSGNREGEPLVFEPIHAVPRLEGLADAWLEHDRVIRRPLDDGVVRVIAGRPVGIRLARGLAPLSLPIPSLQPREALGGHQKAAIALSNGEQAILGPHIGDLDEGATRDRFDQQRGELAKLYGLEQRETVCDLHPDYHTSRLAEHSGEPVRVQHHHAHVVAAMLEAGWLDREVLGVAFDGTGYGPDGTIWGGEVLLATVARYERLGHLRPFALAGGERAVREPWRVAVALVRDAVSDEAAARLGDVRAAPSDADCDRLLTLLQNPRLCAVTTSAGRLFDAVAAIALGAIRCDFEGQAAMRLETVCDRDALGSYTMPVERDSRTNRFQLDWRPVIRSVLRDRLAGAAPGTIAMRFHRAAADSVSELVRVLPPYPVVLGGGVFQNRVLVELLAGRFDAMRRPVGLPGWIPPNDGGLAAGQLAARPGAIDRGK